MYATTRVVQLAAAGSVTKNAPKDCEEAIKRAVQKQQKTDGMVTDKVAGLIKGKTVEDECYGAVLKPGAKKNEQGKYEEKDYQCWGRAGNANVSSSGVVETSEAKQGVPPKKCDLKVTNQKPTDQPPPQQPQQKPEQKPEQKQAGGDQKPPGGMPEMPKLPQSGGGSGGGQPQAGQQQQDCKGGLGSSGAGCPQPVSASLTNSITQPVSDAFAGIGKIANGALDSLFGSGSGQTQNADANVPSSPLNADLQTKQASLGGGTNNFDKPIVVPLNADSGGTNAPNIRGFTSANLSGNTKSSASCNPTWSNFWCIF